jgi:hypothetical protein
MGRLPLFLFMLMPLAAQVPTPRLSMDADGAVVVKLRRGRPLFVNALLSHSLRTGTADPIVLSPAEGRWVDQIQLVVLDAARHEASWPMVPLGKAETSALVLPPRGRVPMSWLLPSSETAKLDAGNYTLRVVLSIGNSPGWNGSVRSASVAVQVEDEPEELTESEKRQLGLLRAREARAMGPIQDQWGILSGLLAQWPKDVAVLTAVSHYFEAAGSPVVAVAYAEAAFDAFLSSSLPRQAPPPELAVLRARLRAQVAEIDAANGRR